MLNQLKDFGIHELVAKRALIVNKNQFDLALDYAFTHAEVTEEDLKQQAAESQSAKKKSNKKIRWIPLELQRLFTKMKYLQCKSISTEGEFSILYFNDCSLVTGQS